jgi:AhpD family alkylhydroperoxidase
MNRLHPIDPATAEGKAKTLLDAVKAGLGGTPNMFRLMATSPATLEAYLSYNRALSHGALPAKVREQIALVAAETNGCDYCASAHTALGNQVKQAGLSQAEIGEIVAHVAINVLTNYFNIAFETEIDFPIVRTQQAKSCLSHR